MRSYEEQSKLDKQLIDAVAGNKPELAKQLIESGADVNCGKDSGYEGFLLWNATRHYDSKMMETLLECGADPNLQGDCYTRATHEAAFEGNRGFIKILHSYGADIDALTHERDEEFPALSPLHIAARFGSHCVAEELLDCGADIECRSSEGKIAIDYAKEGDGIYEMLAEAHAKKSKENIYTELYGDGIDVESVGQATPQRKRKM